MRTLRNPGTATCVAFLLFLLPGASQTQTSSMSNQAKLIVVEPGHFHAALVLKETYPFLANRVTVYAPLGEELLDYLNRIRLFNSRADDPTHWELDVHAGPDPMREMLQDKPGNVVLFTGRNQGKIDRILESLDAGLHVYADKPWIISSADMGKLERALNEAERKNLAAYDIMTERYEVTSQLQREFVNTPAVFGQLQKGTAADPGITAKSIHHVMKIVAGVPLRRPVWFFDTDVYGEGLADVGTHVVDLVQWTAFPGQQLDYRTDIDVLAGKHWPLVLTAGQFQQVTGEKQFPESVSQHVKDGKFEYYCNNAVHYTLRGVHVKLEILWNWEAKEGGDVYEAVFRGTHASAAIRQGKAENYVPELYIVPAEASSRSAVLAAVRAKVESLQDRWPGLAVAESGDDFRIVVPDRFRVGHEAHFAEVTRRFFEYVKSPRTIPAWEKSHMLAKYFVSTKGVELGRGH